VQGGPSSQLKSAEVEDDEDEEMDDAASEHTAAQQEPAGIAPQVCRTSGQHASRCLFKHAQGSCPGQSRSSTSETAKFMKRI
jgi:hypothetical protein